MWVKERKKSTVNLPAWVTDLFFFCFCLHSSDSTARDRTKTKWRTRWRKRSQLNRTGRWKEISFLTVWKGKWGREEMSKCDEVNKKWWSNQGGRDGIKQRKHIVSWCVLINYYSLLSLFFQFVFFLLLPSLALRPAQQKFFFLCFVVVVWFSCSNRIFCFLCVKLVIIIHNNNLSCLFELFSSQ